MKTTPAASNVYGTCGEKMTFDPGRCRTHIGKLACYKHLIPLGSKAKMPHEKRQPSDCPFDKNGGDEGGRTPDLCNAIAALCQTELRPRALGSAFGVSSSEFAEKANFEFIENHRMRQGNRFIIQAMRLGRTLRPWRLCVKPSNAKTFRTQRKSLFSFENRLSFFEEGGDAFSFVLGGKADGKEIDLASEAFVEVRA